MNFIIIAYLNLKVFSILIVLLTTLALNLHLHIVVNKSNKVLLGAFM